MKFKLGDKVLIDNINELEGYILEGYIVGMEINPIEECEVGAEVLDGITYIIRRFAPFYEYGFADFYRTEQSIKLKETV